MQRLRLLRARLPVRRHRPRREERRPGRAEVHAVLRPARRRHGAGLRQGLPDRVDPVRRRWTNCASAPSGGSGRCTSAASPTPACTARTRATASAAAGAFFLLLDEPEVYGLPPDPVVTTRDLPAMWQHAGVAAAGLLGAAIAPRSWGAAMTARRGDGGERRAGGEHARWCRTPSSPPTTGGRWSSSRRGKHWTSRLPVPRRPGRRLVGAGRRRRADRPAGAGPGRPRSAHSARSAGSAGRARPRPGPAGRFVNMLRVSKPTSPMSVGTWLLAGYGPVCWRGRGDRGDRAASRRIGAAGHPRRRACSARRWRPTPPS